MTRIAKVLRPSSRNEFRFDPKPTYRSGSKIPESGIYRVYHLNHRLPHEVTLLADQAFPPCCKCSDEVIFELLVGAPAPKERRGRIVLHQLPCLDPEGEESA